MDVSKVKGGQLVAAVGGIVLLVALLFLNWYSFSTPEVKTPFGEFGGGGGDFGAWDGAGFLGTIANLVILVAGVVAVGLALLTATARTVALPVASSALAGALGIGAVVMTALRIVFRPDSEVPGIDTGLKFGIFVALAGAVVVAIGGWRSMQEEGTTFEQAREQLQDRFGESSGDQAGGPPPGGPPSGGEGSSGPPPS